MSSQVLTEKRQQQEVSSYKVELSSNFAGSAMNPSEMVVAEVEPSGAVLLVLFIDGEWVNFFDLTSVELDALIAANRRRKALMKRAEANGILPMQFDDYPF